MRDSINNRAKVITRGFIETLSILSVLGVTISHSALGAPLRSSLAVTARVACVADGYPGQGADCWDLEGGKRLAGSDQLAPPPSVKNISRLVAGAQHFCAVHASQESPIERLGEKHEILSCWGDNRLKQYGRLDLADGDSVIDAAAGGFSTCALIASRKGNRLQCWDTAGAISQVPPALTHPVNIDIQGDTACSVNVPAPGREQVVCWGGAKITVPARAFILGKENRVTCEVDGSAQKCRSQIPLNPVAGSLQVKLLRRLDKDKQITIDSEASPSVTIRTGTSSKEIPVSDIIDAAISSTQACVLRDDELLCWALRSWDATRIDLTAGSRLYVRRNLELKKATDIGPVLAGLVPDMYTFDADMLSEVSRRAFSADAGQCEMIVKAFTPWILDFRYEGLRERRLGRLVSSLKNVSRGAKNSGPGMEDTKNIVASILSSVIRTMRPVLLRVRPGDGQAAAPALEAEEIVTAIGTNVVQGFPASSVQELKGRIENFARLISANEYVGARASTIMVLVDLL